MKYFKLFKFLFLLMEIIFIIEVSDDQSEDFKIT